MLLPTRCPVCGAPGAAPCPACAARLRPAPAAPIPAGLDACGVLLAYEGAGRRLVTGLKYRNHRAAVTWLGDRLARLVEPPPGSVVTWAPTSGRRRHQRGFDQAELLARAVARRWRRPCRPLLARTGGAAQTGASAAERRGRPALAAVRPVRGPVVVVDDVVTTGSTMRASAAALSGAGATWVAGLAAARTPQRTAFSPRSVPLPSLDVDRLLKFGGEPAEYGQ